MRKWFIGDCQMILEGKQPVVHQCNSVLELRFTGTVLVRSRESYERLDGIICKESGEIALRPDEYPEYSSGSNS
jgi:hypothetical protein